MRQVRILAALGLLAAAAAAKAEVSSTWTLTNDYDFRGTSQSAKDPAVQASIDWADESGWYVGAWASNVDFGDDVDIDYEVDLYTGFSGGDRRRSRLGRRPRLLRLSRRIRRQLPGDLRQAQLRHVLRSAVLLERLRGQLGRTRDLYLGRRRACRLRTAVSRSSRTPATASAISGTAKTASRARSTSTGRSASGYTVGNFDLGAEVGRYDARRRRLRFSNDDVFNTEGRVIFTIATTFPWGEE